MRLGNSPWRACPGAPQSTTITMPYTSDLIRRYVLMIHLSPCVPGLTIWTFHAWTKKRTSPCRDATAQDLAHRHTKRVFFRQGPMTSVRVELWGSRNRNYRYWAGLLHRHFLCLRTYVGPLMAYFSYLSLGFCPQDGPTRAADATQ